jgi:HK97 family phage portal protein
MAWYSDLGKTIRNWRAKTAPLGGFELLRRLSGGDWNITSSLEQYGKSLYVFACISKIAEKTASIDLEMYKVLNSKGDTKEIAVHPALDLLYRVNPFQTRTEFWETTVINLKCTGDAFWLKVRNKGGKVVELWNMRPDMITIVSDPVLFVKAYELHKADGTHVSIAPEDVVHFKYPDPLSQHLGMSPIRPAHRRVQTEDYATAFQRDFFLNSARPDAVIKNPNQSLTDTQKKDIREGWNKRFRGVGNTSKVAILEGGLEYQLISITQKEMDYIESMKFTRDDILVAFKVPKPIVAVVDDVNRANSETAMTIFLGETIRPEIARIVEKINEELIIPDFGAEFYIDFVDPTPTNRTAEIEEHASALQNNWKLINEVRQEEGLPPVKGGWTMYMPVMSVPVGGLPQGDNAGKGIVKFVKAGGATKSSAYEVQPIEKKRAFSFKGRMFLLYHFQIREAISEAMQKALAAKSKRGKKKARKKRRNGYRFSQIPK